MSRHRGDWDDDFYAGEPRPRRRADYGDERFGPPDERRGPPPPPPPPRYEYDERDRPRGDFYRDEYYTGRPPLPRHEDDERDHERRPRRRGATRSHLRCRDIMTRDVTVAQRDTTLEEIARMMRDEDTGVIPVVEPGETNSDSVTEVQRVPARTLSNGRLVGLITDRDIVIRAIAEGGDARTMRAEEVMTKDLHAVRPNDRVIEAIRKMGDKQVRRLPVVDREGLLRGIISMADVALETESDRELAEALEEISSGSSFWNRIFS
ncbi:MAG TPA: CBS domain-containing protein [Pyrinomonadaceae bacterium]|jgi:CBS domain-containing protein|nr:CBS domain-containing protein [Pyrinomonadaceae bacterium]